MSVHFRRIPDDNDQPVERGTYRRVREYWADYLAEKGLPNTYWAEIMCPGCGRVGLIGSNHVVLDSGEVQPSDVCGFDAEWAARHGETSCSFHENIHLDDWDHPSTPRRPE